MKALLSILTSLATLAAASAAELHVNGQTGDDANDGATEKTAWKTLTHAVKQVVPGDKVTVHPGVYFGPVTIDKTGTQEKPIRFTASERGKNRVIISGAESAIRAGERKWTTTEKNPDLFSLALNYPPSRVLCDEVDLFPYPSLAALQTFTLDGGIPGPVHGFAYDASARVLYVRLHAGKIYGEPDPNRRTMKVSPAANAGRNVVAPQNANVAVLADGPAHVILDGFTFETPGVAGVLAKADNVSVLNCWFLGCRTAVAGGTATNAGKRRTSDVLIENCNFTQYPAMEDVREVVGRAAAAKTKFPAFYWQHRRGGPHGYDIGFALEIGTRWKLRGNYIHNVINGLSPWSVAASRDLVVSQNRFERVVRTAIHTGHHAEGMRVHRNLIQDAFQPFAWKPEDGTPWPGPVWIYRNVILQSEAAQTLWARLGWTPGCFHIGVPDENWNRSHMKDVARDTVAVPGEGFVVYNNTIHFPSGTVFSFDGLEARSVRNFKFLNNICIARGLTPPAYRGFDFSGMEFAGNGVVASGDGAAGPGDVFAGRNGVKADSAKELGLADLLHGDVTLAPKGRAVGAGVDLKDLRDGFPDLGALRPGDTWQLHATPSESVKPSKERPPER